MSCGYFVSKVQYSLILVLLILDISCAVVQSNRQFGNEINKLEQIGCAKVRRLLALRMPHDFSTYLPNEPVFDSRVRSEYVTSSQTSPTSTRVTFSADNLPSCRPDRPDLFKARQCNDLDCFCVNVTTGEFLDGTRLNSEDLVDCSTAVLKILLVVHKTSTTPFTSLYHKEKFSVPTSSFSKANTENNYYWESRITRALHELCRASEGYQRVASIRRLPSSDPTQQKIRTMPFEVILYSTGHGKTLASLEELIKHRLDEAYLPGLGPLDPEASYIKRLEDSMPDPEPNFAQHLDVDSDVAEDKGSANNDDIDDLADPESGRDPPQQDYPGNNRRRPISVRQTAHDLAIQNSWRHREILNQPGVIAAIVGSTVAGLLLLILLILFCIYRLRKKDEGSYSLEGPQKGSANSGAYMRAPSREFYA
ncbi:hypothetical protein Aperf_G00000072660 [Anoplocephala perfoliata]